MGFTFTSDESPPEAHRYSGLRFQITHCYVSLFRPTETWDSPEYARKAPINVNRYMTDIMNCPGKTGAHVLDTLVKQFGRVGVYTDECCGGVGDGGGENEGMTGVHATLEGRTPDYVRRRCMGHLPWRVADAGLREMDASFDNLFKVTTGIGTYLHDGVTWNRLKALAVQPVVNGGLGLYTDGSPEFARMFARSPPSSITERPETTARLLEWLLPREMVLRRLVVKDHEQRNLHDRTFIAALETLKSDRERVLRRIAYVLLKKSLFLFYYIESKKSIVDTGDVFTELVQRASDIISSLRADERTLTLLGITPEMLAAEGLVDDGTLNWVEMTVMCADGMTDAMADALMDDCLKFHQLVSMKMQTHLELTAANMNRTTWMAAR